MQMQPTAPNQTPQFGASPNGQFEPKNAQELLDYYNQKKPVDKKFIVMVFGGLFVIVMLIALMFFASNSNSGETVDSSDVVRAQSSILSITEEALPNLNSFQARTTVTTIEGVIASGRNQASTLLSAKQSKALAQVQSPNLAVLEKAATNNNYDEKTLEVLKEELEAYQEILQTVYDTAKKDETKAILVTLSEEAAGLK